jgi:CTP synthase (UTP-ammonia lyase)
VPSDEVTGVERVSGFDGLWCVPGSPYNSMDGALRAIQSARASGRPFLGSCGGFQHAVIEYARNVLGWQDAEHAETSPDAQRAVIAPLQCALVEVQGRVRFVPGSRIAAAYGVAEADEGYHCSYGLNPRFQARLLDGPLRATAHDESGDVRAVELDGHPFYVATLFQSERAALRDAVPPLVVAFVRACMQA